MFENLQLSLQNGSKLHNGNVNSIEEASLRMFRLVQKGHYQLATLCLDNATNLFKKKVSLHRK